MRTSPDRDAYQKSLKQASSLPFFPSAKVEKIPRIQSTKNNLETIPAEPLKENNCILNNSRIETYGTLMCKGSPVYSEKELPKSKSPCFKPSKTKAIQRSPQKLSSFREFLKVTKPEFFPDDAQAILGRRFSGRLLKKKLEVSPKDPLLERCASLPIAVPMFTDRSPSCSRLFDHGSNSFVDHRLDVLFEEVNVGLAYLRESKNSQYQPLLSLLTEVLLYQRDTIRSLSVKQ
eukprot:TRINITY_DN3393_c0_g2_i3.p1 TRINITY_DN3393_c0_g2~~TRINITY_DN3393_c0_g2_i3.p1  ORF type:complete len:232 (+),score=12.77 TRINITY_DN3393_c0_g2_i3:67-762(+)